MAKIFERCLRSWPSRLTHGAARAAAGGGTGGEGTGGRGTGGGGVMAGAARGAAGGKREKEGEKLCTNGDETRPRTPPFT